MNYSNLGYLAFYILLIQIMPFLINYINRNYVKTKSKKYFALMKKFRLVHRILGATLIIIPLVHRALGLSSFFFFFIHYFFPNII